MYDKNSVLRIETTINNPKAFKIFKEVPCKGKQEQQSVPMGKSISNMYRYAEISSSCNNCLLRQLSNAMDINKAKNFKQHIKKFSNPIETKLSKNSENKRTFGKFNLLRNLTCQVFDAIMDGAFLITGFANKQLKKKLIEIEYFSQKELKFPEKVTAKVGRIIAKLRGHKLVSKVSKSNKYYVSKKGSEVLSEILTFKKMYFKTV